jgi:hypothetical protein
MGSCAGVSGKRDYTRPRRQKFIAKQWFTAEMPARSSALAKGPIAPARRHRLGTDAGDQPPFGAELARRKVSSICCCCSFMRLFSMSCLSVSPRSKRFDLTRSSWSARSLIWQWPRTAAGSASCLPWNPRVATV